MTDLSSLEKPDVAINRIFILAPGMNISPFCNHSQKLFQTYTMQLFTEQQQQHPTCCSLQIWRGNETEIASC